MLNTITIDMLIWSIFDPVKKLYTFTIYFFTEKNVKNLSNLFEKVIHEN